MEKIKINTMSGMNLEKPLVTAFKSNTGEYVVFDNEMNGTMGLPIILVTKLVNNSLSLIPDTEWNSVKEVLRLIISGNQVDYISVGESISAEDNFFKQLTLPVASFEALKNNYKPVGVDSLESKVENAAPVLDNVVQKPEVVEPVNVAPQVQQPVENTVVMPDAPVQSQTIASVNPVMPEVAQVTPEVNQTVVDAPVEQHVNNTEVPVDFTADKEAFLKACENMFDALVAKFNNK